MAGSRVVGRSAPLTVAARGNAPAPCPCAGVSPCGAGPTWASVLGGRALQHTQTDVGCPPGPRLRLAGALLPWPPSACEGPRTGSHQLTAGPLPEAVWPLLLPLAEPASGASAPGPPRPDGLLQTGDASPVWPGLGRVSSHTPPHTHPSPAPHAHPLHAAHTRLDAHPFATRTRFRSVAGFVVCLSGLPLPTHILPAPLRSGVPCLGRRPGYRHP